MLSHRGTKRIPPPHRVVGAHGGHHPYAGGEGKEECRQRVRQLGEAVLEGTRAGAGGAGGPRAAVLVLDVGGEGRGYRQGACQICPGEAALEGARGLRATALVLDAGAEGREFRQRAHPLRELDLGGARAGARGARSPRAAALVPDAEGKGKECEQWARQLPDPALGSTRAGARGARGRPRAPALVSAGILQSCEDATLERRGGPAKLS